MSSSSDVRAAQIGSGVFGISPSPNFHFDKTLYSQIEKTWLQQLKKCIDEQKGKFSFGRFGESAVAYEKLVGLSDKVQELVDDNPLNDIQLRHNKIKIAEFVRDNLVGIIQDKYKPKCTSVFNDTRIYALQEPLAEAGGFRKNNRKTRRSKKSRKPTRRRR